MSTVLLIDASPLIYANFAQVGHFSTKAGEPTGLRYGFTRSVRSYVEKTGADSTCICFDKPGQVKKAEGITSYKSDRVVTEEKKTMWSQVPALRELIGLTRWAQADAEGYEADDVIGHLGRKFAAGGHTVYIVSPDNDILQLTDPLIKIWMPPKSKVKAWIKDEAYCTTKFGVYPHNLLHYRAMVGDASDNVAGVKSGKAFEEEWQQKVNTLADGRQVSPDQFVELFQLSASDAAVYRSNFNLMTLHDPGDALVIQKGAKDRVALEELFNRLEMKSMLAMLSDISGR